MRGPEECTIKVFLPGRSNPDNLRSPLSASLHLHGRSLLAEGVKEISLTLSQRVKEDAKEFVDKNGAVKAIEFLRKKFLTIFLDKDLEELYKINISFLEDTSNIPTINTIGTWLKKNKNDYFATVLTEQDYDEELVNTLFRQ